MSPENVNNQKQIEAQESNANIQETCEHHWQIEIPQGPISQGVCKKCGATQPFRNSRESDNNVYMGQVRRDPTLLPSRHSAVNEYDGTSSLD